ncbi:fatty acid synthase S-acetyltransferase [Cercophora scortea]|uniref:Fatty acid synthase S-acetyltransferase n=1 Tax=Cercophora scortea TaxID=314031 RepID=A0AAE0MA03_9PEZI|nr:fatty acid synthase S-acetyltransferase [Cercophora scortea]
MSAPSADPTADFQPPGTVPNHATPMIDQDKMEPVAIIGLALRFPQDATNPETFWKMLLEGRSAMTDAPKDRFNLDGVYYPGSDRAGTIPVRGGHYLKEDFAAFDAPFFSISPAEASCMDPQQRGVLECAYHALENAGIPMEKASGSKTSVHVGCWSHEYEAIFRRDPEMTVSHLTTGAGGALIPNRISWFYNLLGPSLAVDTGCSSSLNALHLACQTLRNGEATMGLVGGCNLFYGADSIATLAHMNFLSTDGVCYSFDHRANGYSRGEGFGFVVLKMLSDALRDGDTIRAVIRATGSNQDGRTPGITNPSSEAQEALIRETYARAGLDLKTTRYFEAHGTGTPVGDPLEARAMGSAFKDERSVEQPLIVGAVKSNIGHLEGASGIAGLIKATLVLEHGVIPPNIWFEKPNPKIDPEWNLKFPTEPMLWPQDGLRRASVNSFGYGGTNTHAILDDAYHYLKSRSLQGRHHTVQRPSLPEYPIVVPDKTVNGTLVGPPREFGEHASVTLTNGSSATAISDRKRLFVFSSFDEDGLRRIIDSYVQQLELDPLADENAFLRDLAYTLGCKRSVFSWKTFTTASTCSELRENMRTSLSKPIRSSGVPKIAFVFTGQGAQWHAMGRELMVYPVYRKALEDADRYLKELGCEWSLLDELSKDALASNINNPAYSQPICSVLQMGLIDLLKTWGIQPAAVVGHSSGEIAAAYSAGGISKESAWRLSYFRGAVSSTLAKSPDSDGAMLAVQLSVADVQPYLDRAISTESDYVTVGCINSPTNVTLSGARETVTKIHLALREDNIFCQMLKVENAYHSKFMDQVAAEYKELVGVLQVAPLSTTEEQHRVPVMFSSVTGEPVEISVLRNEEYWVENMVSPVRFSDSLSSMVSKTNGLTHLLEIGPHGALRRPVKDTLGTLPKASAVVYDSLLARNHAATDTFLEALGRLFCQGLSFNMEALSMINEGDGKVELLVDAPAYPFNHSQRYWLESRISKNQRFRRHLPHELMGTQVPDWNPSEARWRKYIRVQDSNWIKDHEVTGKVLYPAAGMLAMAIEAARQIADPERKITGFRIKEAVFDKALIIPTTSDGVEIQFYLQSSRISNFAASPSWSNFKLCSYENGGWLDHCRGSIMVELEGSLATEDGNREKQQQQEQDLETARALHDSCNILVESKSFYETLHICGLGFGASFQTLRSIRYNMKQEATALVHIGDKFRPSTMGIHVIHPTTLDGVIQSVFPALTKGGQDAMQTLVPTFVQDLWISSGICDESVESLRVCTTARMKGFREADCSIITTNPSGDKLLAKLSGFRAVSVSDRAASHNDREWRRLCFNIEWQPDIDLLDSTQAHELFNATNLTSSPDKENESMEFAAFYFISKALAHVDLNKTVPPTEHLRKYVEWIRHQVERYNNGSLVHGKPEWASLLNNQDHIKEVLEELSTSYYGKLVLRIGPNLPSVLDGEVDALQLLFKDDLVANVYRHSLGADISAIKIQHFVNTLAHKNPKLKILEIGAGTGGATAPILKALSRHGEDEVGAARFARYMYTDISPSFFERAKEEFCDHGDRMSFKVLDIEQDPVEQGFTAGEYDLLVLHATASLDVTLRNARKLLKPNGKILLFEVCNPDAIRSGLAFGLLPGWWQSIESNRRWGPLIYENDWDDVFRRNGFTGNDICLRDWEDAHNHMTTIMVSSVKPPGSLETAKQVPKTIIIADDNSPFQQTVADEIRKRLMELSASELSISICNPRSVCEISVEHKLCIFLPELERPFLAQMSTEDFACLHHMVASNNVLWLTHSSPDSADNLAFELVIGFARAVRSENSLLRFTTVAIESVGSPETVATTAAKIIQTTTLNNSGLDELNAEDEFMEKDGLICINRVVEANYLNDNIARQHATPRAEPHALSIDRPVKLTIASPGLLDTLQFVDDTEVSLPLSEDQVEMEVKAVGMNFVDLMNALAQISGNFLGAECAGIVTRAGKNTRFKPGDRVWAATTDAYRTLARTHDSLVQLMPAELSFEEAASLPSVYGTCYYALCDVARLRKGEKILIHSAAGGVGQAAIWLAQLAGAEIFATVGMQEKREFLTQTFGIPDDHIFSSRDPVSFSLGIMRATGGVGVDVVLNSLAGEALRVTWECMAPFGRFLEVGKKDILSFANLPMHPFAKNVSFTAIDLLYVLQSNLPLARRIFEEVKLLVDAGKIRGPQPLNVYGYSQIETAFRVMQAGKHIGKIVVKPEPGEIVQIVPDRRPSWTFGASATYLISGGLGGLGRSMARWMVRRGARNLILLSRSGPTTEQAKSLVTELEAAGCTISTPICDISNEDELASVLATCLESMPPIKGCIQGAMVLRDSTFSNMSLPDFHAALVPKVQGSWNLHKLLPRGLDFFLLLSSAAGVIGTTGQSNYTAGNTYQDALARYRVLHGEKAISLNLGMILSVGFVAERPDYMDVLMQRGFWPIRETEFLGMLEYHCNPELPLASLLRAQVVTGMETPASLKARGGDEAFWMPKPLFRNLHQMDHNIEAANADTTGAGGANFAALLGAVTSMDEAGVIVTDALTYKLAKSLSIPREEIDPQKPMHSYGVDSLVAVEMRNWLAKELRADVAVFELMSNASIAGIGGVVAAKSRLLSINSGVAEETSTG